MAALPLSSIEDLAARLEETPDKAMDQALASARETITSAVLPDYWDDDDDLIPSSLHEACLIEAQAIYARPESSFGVEAFALGGDSAPGFLTTDPTFNKLLFPWRQPRIGSAERVE